MGLVKPDLNTFAKIKVIGIGGGSAKAGFVEVLYITELIGIVLIWTGYRIIHKSTAGSVYAKQQKDEFHNGGKS